MKGLAEPDGNAASARAGPFAEELPAGEAEATAPQLVEIDRYDRRVGALGDMQDAGFERLQLAAARDVALGKDADDLAGVQRVAGRVQSRAHGLGPGVE